MIYFVQMNFVAIVWYLLFVTFDTAPFEFVTFEMQPFTFCDIWIRVIATFAFVTLPYCLDVSCVT